MTQIKVTQNCFVNITIIWLQCSLSDFVKHGSALEWSDPHELAPGFEVFQMKGTHIGA